MRKEVNIRIAGEAGQGMQTIGLALCSIFKKAGFNVFANQDYMSRIRGGNNFFQIRIAQAPVYTLREKVDITVALDRDSFLIHRGAITDGGIIIIDAGEFNISGGERYIVDIPLYKISRDKGGSDIFINTTSCGVIAAMVRIDFRYVEEVLKNTFLRKGDKVAIKNIDAARAGYDYVAEHFDGDEFKVTPAGINGKQYLLLNGNEAIALGAIKSGCKFYTAYPMTPSTSIMNFMVHYADNFDILVEQAEDEIAAVNMAIGASFAGVRSMTGTSGGGFALMVEGLSLAGMTETPLVIAEVQRPGPATGLPTRTEQSDLEFVLHAGHGEFAKVVFTPGTIEEAFYLTTKAFDIAERYQIPVVILSDQHLADSYRSIPSSGLKAFPVRRHIIPKEESSNIKDYKRYVITSSGISPRAVPSWIKDVIYADSDEHTEEGHITESAEVRREMVKKRFHKKMRLLKQDIEPPLCERIEGSTTLFIGYGSTYGVLKELSLEVKKAGIIHLPQVWPFPSEILQRVIGEKKNIITIEGNARGQLAHLLRRETGIEARDSILRFDGRPFNLDYVLKEISGKRKRYGAGDRQV